MQKEENVCKLWCEKTITAENAAKINERIVQNYKFDWFIDGLPAATTGKDTHASGEDSKYYMVGFPLGEVDKVTEMRGFECAFQQMLFFNP